jgi:FAD synthase
LEQFLKSRSMILAGELPAQRIINETKSVRKAATEARMMTTSTPSSISTCTSSEMVRTSRRKEAMREVSIDCVVSLLGYQYRVDG